MKTSICGLVTTCLLLGGCFDQEAVDREAAELAVTDEEIEAVVDARLDARLADYAGRIAALEAAVGLPYDGDTDLGARVTAVEQAVDALDPAELGDRVQALEDAGFVTVETDPVYAASAAGAIAQDDVANWNDAHGWGDHIQAGYLTAELDPAFLGSVASAIAQGDLDAWNVALGWGNHASAGYVTVETDPIFTSSVAASIAQTSIDEWDLAYGWGDHAAPGYLTAYTETDPVASAAGYLTETELDLCPVGYVHDPTETAFTLCYDPDSALGADEMVRVGDYWVDRHEGSVWQNADCTGSQYGAAGDDYDAGFPDNGNWTVPLYACAVPGVPPSRGLTWFQAQQSCALSGKDLCSSEQWQAAASGTYDPGAFDGDAGGACNTLSGTGNARPTGSAGAVPSASDSCVSVWGVEDMIGNLWEWTSDWGVGGQTWMTAAGQTSFPWPTGYGNDVTQNVNGIAHNPGGSPEWGLPAAVMRGGGSDNGNNAGTFTYDRWGGPTRQHAKIGFRCCRGR